MSPEIFKHPNFTHAADIAIICQPLQNLKINYFAHVYVDKSNQFSAIANNPAYSEYYIKNKGYNLDIHLADLSKLGNHIIWDALELSGRTAIEHQNGAQFGIEHVFTIIEQDQNGVHYYHFGSNMMGKAINQIYLTNIDLLKLFIRYFKDKIFSDRLLRKAYDLKFSIDADGGLFLTKTDPDQSDQHKIKQAFLKDIQLISPSNKNLKILSTREIEIMTWLHHGKTANEIAEILHLADVTVNKHIANIKEKTQCYTQFQLGEFFSKNSFATTI